MGWFRKPLTADDLKADLIKGGWGDRFDVLPNFGGLVKCRKCGCATKAGWLATHLEHCG